MAVVVEERAFGFQVAFVGQHEQSRDLVDQGEVVRRDAGEIAGHRSPGVPEQQLIAEPMRRFCNDVSVHEPVAAIPSPSATPKRVTSTAPARWPSHT